MKRLLLVRHGQSEWNALGKWQGKADPPLTEFGHAQARHAASRLPTFDRLAASSLIRARQTAEGIAAERGIDPMDVLVEPRIMERDAGGFSGLTRIEIEEQFPGYLAEGRWPDGWEYAAELVERVRAGLDTLAEQLDPGQTMVAITHGGVIYALEESLGEPFDKIGNLGARWFGLDAGVLTLGERVHLLDTDEETVPDQL